jgi:glycosyltransferase involved in cell wall biosynthesis
MDTNSRTGISVIVTTDPRLDFHLGRCLASIEWQLRPSDELLIVGDGYKPIPTTISTLPEIINSQLRGVSAARNAGLARSTNAWIKFIDVDDLLAPFALNAFRAIRGQLEEIANEKIAVIAGGQLKIHNGVFVGFTQPVSIERIIEHANPTLVSQCFIRRDAAVSVGGFDERIEFEEDWDFWLRLYRAGHRFATTQVPVCCYWISDVERESKHPSHLVEGVDVREYLRRKYNLADAVL